MEPTGMSRTWDFFRIFHPKAAFGCNQRPNSMAATHCADASCTHTGKRCGQIALAFQGKIPVRNTGATGIDTI
jgi:hypothetical protein